ncbi:MAG: NAD(P)H-dependent oxidoreductase [Verrucomicrobia bacterium]|nr:NAD(P)H-dependent oxidoreductase [Verrucomicrobiota bacterium]
MKILHVFANPKPTEESASKQLAAAFFGKLVEMNPDVEIENVDLYDDPPPFLSYETYCAFWYPVMIEGYTTTDKDDEAMAYAKKHAEIFNSADVLVIRLRCGTSRCRAF